MLRMLVQRQCGHRLGRGDARQPLALQSGVPAGGQQLGAEHGSGQPRRRRQRVAELLGDHRRIGQTQPQAAMRLGDQHAGKAHLGAARPQRARKAVAVVGVAQRTQVRDRRLLAQECACAVAQHRLFGIQ